MSKKFWIGIATALLVLVALFLLRGVIRMRVAPLAVYAGYKHSLQQSYAHFDTELGSPLSGFGFKDNAGGGPSCSENTAQRFFVEVGCNMTEIKQTDNIDAAYIAKYAAGFDGLQGKLEAYGWTAHSSEGTTSSLKQLMDPAPDAPHMSSYYGYIRFDKTINGNQCSLTISRFDYLYAAQWCSRVSKIGVE